MPPTVSRQLPPARNDPPRKGGGGLLSKAAPVSEQTDDWIHMLLYGKNRVGKTTLACQFPKPLLLVAVEPSKTGGSRSVRNVRGVDCIRLTRSDDVAALGHELKSDGKYQTVVLDSGTSLDEITLAEVCGWEETAALLRFGRVSQDQYTERTERVRKVLRPYLDFPRHLVVVCNEKDHNPPEGRKSSMVRGPQAESFFAGAMSAGTIRWLQDSCDYVCQLFMDKEVERVANTVGKTVTYTEQETGKFVRRLRMGYHPNFAAGVRSEAPEGVPEWVDEPTWGKIEAVSKGRYKADQ